jgi:hypothetical protein
MKVNEGIACPEKRAGIEKKEMPPLRLAALLNKHLSEGKFASRRSVHSHVVYISHRDQYDNKTTKPLEGGG